MLHSHCFYMNFKNYSNYFSHVLTSQNSRNFHQLRKLQSVSFSQETLTGGESVDTFVIVRNKYNMISVEW